MKKFLKVLLFITSPLWGIFAIIYIIGEEIVEDTIELWKNISRFMDK